MNNVPINESQLQPDDVYHWLQRRAEESNLVIRFDFDKVKVKNKWLYIPFYIPGKEIDEQLKQIQSIQHEWMDQEPQPEWDFLLIPSAN